MNFWHFPDSFDPRNLFLIATTKHRRASSFTPEFIYTFLSFFIFRLRDSAWPQLLKQNDNLLLHLRQHFQTFTDAAGKRAQLECSEKVLWGVVVGVGARRNMTRIESSGSFLTPVSSGEVVLNAVIWYGVVLLWRSHLVTHRIWSHIDQEWKSENFLLTPPTDSNITACLY